MRKFWPSGIYKQIDREYSAAIQNKVAERMRKRRFALFLFVFVSFGLMYAVPAEDLPETTYDESEGVAGIA